MMGWFGGRPHRDGAPQALDPLAVGLPPAPPTADPAPSSPAASGRRDRALAGGKRILIDGMAEKVLHGWLQNRHQTLFPLTVNLRTLTGEQAAALAGWMAVALLATPGLALDANRVWLASVGADAATMAVLEAALASPPPLHRALAEITQHGLTAYAYVVALLAADPQDPATPAFLDYVAARLALPTTVVRSATRRYRR